jgi:hypothetical protein
VPFWLTGLTSPEAARSSASASARTDMVRCSGKEDGDGKKLERMREPFYLCGKRHSRMTGVVKFSKLEDTTINEQVNTLTCFTSRWIVPADGPPLVLITQYLHHYTMTAFCYPLLTIIDCGQPSSESIYECTLT